MDRQCDNLIVFQRCWHRDCGCEIQYAILLQPGFIWGWVVDVCQAKDMRAERAPVDRVGAEGSNDTGNVGTEDERELVADEEARVSTVGVVGNCYRKCVR